MNVNSEEIPIGSHLLNLADRISVIVFRVYYLNKNEFLALSFCDGITVGQLQANCIGRGNWSKKRTEIIGKVR